jgi:hypothetical protein
MIRKSGFRFSRLREAQTTSFRGIASAGEGWPKRSFSKEAKAKC